MYPTLTSSASSSIRSFLMKRTSFERSANRLRGITLVACDYYTIFGKSCQPKIPTAPFPASFFFAVLLWSRPLGGDSLSISFPGSFTVAAALPAEKLHYRESRPRLSVFLQAIFGSPPGLPRFNPGLPPFPRLWRPLSGAAAYSFYNNLLKDTIIYRYYCPKNVIGCRSLFVTFSVSFSSPANCLF